MAVTTNSISVVKTPTEGDWWFVSQYSADWSGVETIKAAVTAKCHYIKKIQVFGVSTTDMTVSFGIGDDTSALTTIYIGPCAVPDAGGEWTIDFGPDHCMKVDSGSAFNMDAVAGPIAIIVQGKTAT